jgi:8-oxo-dGTP pyrophosphatase MutT (NUDIX family)
MTTPVRPRDAASLVPLRTTPKGIEVLMGRRPPKSKFVPDVFVFPGGKLDPHDFEVRPARNMAPEVERTVRATKKCTAARAVALANAVIRETYEETGLMLAEKATQSGHTDPAWADFTSEGLAPDHAPLLCLARAITPPSQPMRFHARFFGVLDAKWRGTLTPNTELLDVAWRSLEGALTLPIIDVTEVILHQVQTRLKNEVQGSLGPQGPAPLLSYRNGLMMIGR